MAIDTSLMGLTSASHVNTGRKIQVKGSGFKTGLLPTAMGTPGNKSSAFEENSSPLKQNPLIRKRPATS